MQKTQRLSSHPDSAALDLAILTTRTTLSAPTLPPESWAPPSLQRSTTYRRRQHSFPAALPLPEDTAFCNARSDKPLRSRHKLGARHHRPVPAHQPCRTSASGAHHTVCLSRPSHCRHAGRSACISLCGGIIVVAVSLPAWCKLGPGCTGQTVSAAMQLLILT